MATKPFHIGCILTITTGSLVSTKHVGGIYEILNFMTGDNLYTHQLPRVMEECKPYLLKQHPQLADVDASSVNPENWRAWLDDQVAKFGETLPVDTLPPGDHYYIEPLSELAEKVHPDKIITASIDSRTEAK